MWNILSLGRVIGRYVLETWFVVYAYVFEHPQNTTSEARKIDFKHNRCLVEALAILANLTDTNPYV